MFSKHETEVIKIIGRKKISINDISKSFYGMDYPPLEFKNYIASVVRRIGRKCRTNNHSWLIRGEGAGRKGRIVWKSNRGLK